MFKRTFRLPSPALVVSMIALGLVLGGTAIAASTAKHGDKKADIALIKKLAPTLSVRHATAAKSAGTATNATNATNADHATSADGLTTLPSGQSESGMFAAGSGAEDVSSTKGWIGAAINYPRPLAAKITDANVIEVDGVGPVTHCSAPGHADPGYLCLYDVVKNAIGQVSVWSDDSGTGFTTPSLGVLVYWQPTAVDAYVGGEWTVTAP